MQIQRWVSGETTVNYAVGPVYYNTALSLDNASPTRNAELTIYLRVLMLPLSLHFAKTVQLTDAAGNKYSGKVYDVPDPNMPGRTRQVEVRNWNTNGTHSEFEQFKQMVKMHAEIFWNNTNLCLIPPPSYSGLDWPTTRPTHRLNLDCKFEIVQAMGSKDAHITIYNTKLARANDPYMLRSSVGRVGYLDSGDLTPGVVWSNQVGIAGTPIQVGTDWTIPHEFGHAIGLPHIGQSTGHQPCMHAISASPADGHASLACYLGPTPDLSLNIMGRGSRVSTHNSLPWLLRAPLHTGTSLADWRVDLPSRPPVSLNPPRPTTLSPQAANRVAP